MTFANYSLSLHIIWWHRPQKRYALHFLDFYDRLPSAVMKDSVPQGYLVRRLKLSGPREFTPQAFDIVSRQLVPAVTLHDLTLRVHCKFRLRDFQAPDVRCRQIDLVGQLSDFVCQVFINAAESGVCVVHPLSEHLIVVIDVVTKNLRSTFESLHTCSDVVGGFIHERAALHLDSLQPIYDVLD